MGRVALGIRYPTDVLAGARLGAGAAVLCWWVGRRLSDTLADRIGALRAAVIARGGAALRGAA